MGAIIQIWEIPSLDKSMEIQNWGFQDIFFNNIK